MKSLLLACQLKKTINQMKSSLTQSEILRNDYKSSEIPSDQ
jgi:hypothetical protein